ncbi:MAG: carbamoyltransferase HypF [Mariniphaga sp.]
MKNITIQLVVTGLVQGVGFRPFIYRIALNHGLHGWVKNTNENVIIRLTGKAEQIEYFLSSLSKEAPQAAMIENILKEFLETEDFSDFRILESHNVSEEITEISPDIAVCNDCLKDIELKGNRLDYPFVNCTNCGPRFTIIRDLPYDRAKTTMSLFPICPDCLKEYRTISDRRFHAQPIACSKCGPNYELIIPHKLVGKEIIEIIEIIEIKEPGEIKEIVEILGRLSHIIDNGGVVAIKGLGGLNLACDAFNDGAVTKLRNIKNRESKPFAVMFRDIESVKQYATLSQEEEKSLCSWRKPIVLLEIKKTLTKGINSGVNLIGAMLPYMPIHYQLFSHLSTSAIVLTSGNLSNEPILIENKEALRQFSSLTDAIVLHNRDIYNRTDDSVVRIIGAKERVFRRSRGYVPAPVRMGLHVDGILAFGAELSNCFCVGKGDKAFISQHIGDLKGLETTIFYEETLARFIQLFRIKPTLLAVDLHPDYVSTRRAEKFAPLPVVIVQHHHAHVASCMAEHKLDEKVIGVAFDGTGYGDDGNIWGAEFLICDLVDYQRITHFDYLPLPGGDLANEEPWRMAVSYLYKIYGREFLDIDLQFLKETDPEKVEMLIRMIDRKINCPLTSSSGRLFDAVASLLRLCQVASFPAQGPMLLESSLTSEMSFQQEESEFMQYSCRFDGTIHVEDIIHGIVDDLQFGTNNGMIAVKFHNTIISVIFETVKSISLQEGINKVVLSGGVFQNKYLLEGTESILKKNNFQVYSQSAVPTNDGGIALGQMAIAAKRRATGCV